MTNPPTPASRRARLRELIASGRTVLAPGATDALSARLIESAGFECVYIGSYATAASRFGLPDTGLLSLNDLVEQARTIVNAVRVPVIADAEGGFNDAANMWRIVDMPGHGVAEHEDAAIVLFYALSTLVQFDALQLALEKFKRDGAFAGRVADLEEFLGFTRRGARPTP